ncbi:MAG: division/cell wall cluster transcriptional repressor MraZ [Clostridiales bacterium]|nr:division/cell wall cluster transcriptional repressor MraZ [Clostridiales bacterium]
MLIGLYRHTIDGKGRLVIPQRFRADLGARFVITRGLDGCLTVYPLSEWGRLVEQIKAAPMSEGRTMQRYFFAHAEEAEQDAQGRVMLPAELRQMVGIEREVVVVGVESVMEVWDPAAWEDFSRKATESDVLEALRKSGM